jgi:cyclophilin family peptidyl-prolyl cis-trans isomerase/HEAT repeat protein
MTRKSPVLALSAALVLGAVSLSAQSEAGVAALASVLAAEDARRFDEPLFRRALSDPDSSIRREAALGLGRLRDPAAIPLLVPRLLDPDAEVETSVVFALGLIGDSSAVPALIQRTQDPSPIAGTTARELVTALARLGGTDAAGFLGSILEGNRWKDRDDADDLVQWAALEAWRLGSAAPTGLLLGLTRDSKEELRYGALYSLGRLRVRDAGSRLLDAMGDPSAAVRASSARGLIRTYADSAHLDPEVVADALARATRDSDAGVRVQALRSLGTYHLPRLAAKALPLLEDPIPNIQVQAAMTLGDLGGSTATANLTRIVSGTKGSFARRREALVSLARVDTAAFAAQAGRWASGPDWRERAAAADGWARVNPGALDPFLGDRDARVVAAALESWGEQVPGPDPLLVVACRKLARNRDAAVRSVAADCLARAASPTDLPLLVEMYQAAARDSFPEAALSALAGVLAIAKAAPEGAEAVEGSVLGQLSPPQNYVIRRWAEENWPAAADRWGAAYPVATGRTMEDYRDIVRRLQMGPDSIRYPRVKVDVADLGVMQLELFGPDAPLTVANFLRLVDRRYFDGQRFHRVVPNFVLQTGDPRGDGWGGPGATIRDEINQRRYGSYSVGMALSGPDSGGSQWFITLSPQPHLDGAYTMFGRVIDGLPVLARVTQGDLIRSIRR